MNLVIDRGNTQDKVSVFKDSEIVFCEKYHRLSVEDLERLNSMYPLLKNAIYCSVAKDDNKEEIISFLKANYLFLDSDKWNTNIKIFYQTPQTLGQDRLAAVVGAYSLYPRTNSLIVDCGSCITFDFITLSGEYCGGSISCGFRMKFQALHNFTANLPLLDEIKSVSLLGTSTQDSILSGVINGTLEEVKGIIKQYRQMFEEVNVVLTGGDAEFLSSNITIKHSVEPNLVLYGLNNILNENAKTNN
ncbi:MAG: type III pantothenate kinase [Bacteroidales bacterium]|jgi:type III pantothenate kinase|nr:type III pantothenate kinase [Bacteroidales bacterium]